MSGEAKGLWPSLCRAAASIAAEFYHTAVNIRNSAYDSGRRKVHRIEGPRIICLGNITAGGTGKTPITLWIARRLIQAGHHPAILMRGYKRGRSESDEQLELTQALPGTPVVAEPDRVAGARHIASAHPHVNIILLDDGFQHRRLHRDLDLVLIDAVNPFGYDRLLPRGLLREDTGSLMRADAVIITRADQVSEKRVSDLGVVVEAHSRHLPIAVFETVWSAVLDERDERAALDGKAVLPFCGVGNPDAFFSAAGKKARIVAPTAFEDHHFYRRHDLEGLATAAKARGADALLTTVKDWVKVKPLIQSAPIDLPVWRAVMEMRPVTGGDALMNRIESTIRGTPAVSAKPKAEPTP